MVNIGFLWGFKLLCNQECTESVGFHDAWGRQFHPWREWSHSTGELIIIRIIEMKFHFFIGKREQTLRTVYYFSLYINIMKATMTIMSW